MRNAIYVSRYIITENMFPEMYLAQQQGGNQASCNFGVRNQETRKKL